MTTRAIKKLTKKDDLKLLQEKLGKNNEAEESDEQEISEEETFNAPKNKFNFLVRFI
jgi:hypothetical protein